MAMTTTPVKTDRAPAAVGPYSQAVKAGGFVFASGQIALDPATGTLAPGGVEAETERALANLRAVLEAAGSSMAGVVKTTCYLADMADFAAFNAVYAKHFPGRPARSTVAVRELPRGARVEVDAVALIAPEA